MYIRNEEIAARLREHKIQQIKNAGFEQGRQMAREGLDLPDWHTPKTAQAIQKRDFDWHLNNLMPKRPNIKSHRLTADFHVTEELAMRGIFAGRIKLSTRSI